MKKKLCTIILTLVLALTFTACGKNESDKNSNSGSSDKNSNISSDDGASYTKNTEDASDNEPATSGSFADISAMDYDEAVAYLDSLPETDASYFEITTDEMADGEAAITDYSGTDEVVIIPETIDGLKIVQLNKWSFTNNDEILAVKLPNTVRVIGETAFGNCTKLIYLTGLENVETLSNGAFNMCLDLRTVKFTDSVTEIEGYIVFANQSNCTVIAPKGSCVADYVTELIPLGNDGLTLEEY